MKGEDRREMDVLVGRNEIDAAGYREVEVVRKRGVQLGVLAALGFPGKLGNQDK